MIQPSDIRYVAPLDGGYAVVAKSGIGWHIRTFARLYMLFDCHTMPQGSPAAQWVYKVARTCARGRRFCQ